MVTYERKLNDTDVCTVTTCVTRYPIGTLLQFPNVPKCLDLLLATSGNYLATQHNTTDAVCSGGKQTNRNK
jgi:hypothetical protein